MKRRPATPRRDRARPIRVALIGSGWFPDEIGGLNRYVTNLVEGLRRTDAVEPTALVMGPVEAPSDDIVVAARRGDRLSRRLAAGVRSARSLDADVVDAHLALYSLLPVRLTRLRRVPLVVHFHGPWSDEGRHAGTSSAAHAFVKHRVERAVYRRARRCVVLTSAFKRVLVERYGVAPWDVIVVPPGVDVDRFTPGDKASARAALDLPQGAFVACCVRRLVPRMGHDVLLDAWHAVQAERGPDAVLVIAGDGPLRSRLETRARADGLGVNVRFVGRVSDDELVRIYQAADVNVVPSVALEGFGMIVLEAAACGTPSVVTRVGGLPEAVHGLDPSLVVDPGSPDALAARLLDRLPSPDQARAFAAAHSWLRVAERHAEVYNDAVTDPAPARRRVVYLDHTARLSGGELALLRLLPHLSDVDPHVILAEDGPLANALVAEGISVEVMPMPARAQSATRGTMHVGGLSLRTMIGSATYTVRVALRLRALRPDLVHTNSLKAGVYGAIAARAAGVPVVWHVRDRIADDYLPSTAVTVVRMLISRLASGCVANSHATLATVEAPGRSIVLPSVVPPITDRRDPAEPGRPPGRTVFGIVGRLAAWKGQDVFLRAFAHAFPDSDQRAVVIGSAVFGGEDERYAAGLVDLVGELGIDDRVEFRGFRGDVAAELARLDVLVHASTLPEPFGQVVVEGMACGLAVVASADGGPLETITHGVDGELFPPGDIDRLAELLRKLDGDPELRSRLGAAGLVRSRDFRPEPIAADLERFYDVVLSGRTAEDDGSVIAVINHRSSLA